jgi:DNA-binding SARP family transcriptional activator
MIGDYAHDDPGPSPGAPVEVRILGPLEIRVDDRTIDLGRPQQRALAALLAVHAGEVVSVDRLVDALWGEDLPATAHHAVQVYVCGLRAALRDGGAGGDVIETTAPGYRLRVPDAAIDARCAERAAVEAAGLLRDGAVAAARERLGVALGSWRGEPLAEFAYEEWAAAEVRRLDELHLHLVELAIGADLAMGRCADVVPDLTHLAHRYPHRERLWGMLMTALHRCGRSAEALAIYTGAAETLHEALGVEPSLDLRAVRRGILSDLNGGEAAPGGRRDPARPSWALW